MNDILPPKRPSQSGAPQPSLHPRPAQPQLPRPGSAYRGGSQTQDSRRVPQSVDPQLLQKDQEPLLEAPHKPLLLDAPRRSVKKIVIWVVGVILALLVLAAGAAYMWYQDALNPVSGTEAEKISIKINSGSTFEQIGQELETKQLIRSSLAFTIYTRLTDTHAGLQAGTYSLSPSESTPQIVEHLTSGNVDQFSITFLPGATLAENRAGLIKAGYSESEVDAALAKTYESPLFADKPEGTDLEGYIYGETYTFSSDTSVETVLQSTFDEFYKKLDENNLIAGFKAQGLDLYQAITLASIIQREVPTAADQKQVAQVFYTRLKDGMELGSDVTYQYAAKKLGVDPTPDLDSPYNTRKYPGLPPGPIASPGLSALEAVAHPASGDFVYFLSGDDDKTYFSRTIEEHEKNIVDHCQVKCSIL